MLFFGKFHIHKKKWADFFVIFVIQIKNYKIRFNLVLILKASYRGAILMQFW